MNHFKNPSFILNDALHTPSMSLSDCEASDLLDHGITPWQIRPRLHLVDPGIQPGLHIEDESELPLALTDSKERRGI